MHKLARSLVAYLLLPLLGTSAHQATAQHAAGDAPLAASAVGDEKAPLSYEEAAARLQHRDFRVRQQSYKLLAEAGAAAVPAVLEAARGGDRETRDRAISLLLSTALSRRKEASQAGEIALESLVSSADGRMVRAARTALAELKGSKVMRAIDRIHGLGGTVTSTTGVDLEPEGPFAVQINDKWTGGDESLSLLSDLDNVTWVSLEGSPITNEGLVHISQLTELEHLFLGYSRVTGEGLPRLGKLPKVKRLSLRGLSVKDTELASLPEMPLLAELGLDDTAITDEGLIHLEKFASVTKLWLDNTKISDKGLVHLQKLPALETLYLQRTDVAGPGLEDLKTLSGLRYLSLKRVRLRPGTLAHIAQLSQLEILGLDDTNVTDQQLAELMPLKHLRTLWLSKTPITDAAVEHLVRLKSLQNLHLHASQVNEAGADKIREQLPGCHVGR